MDYLIEEQDIHPTTITAIRYLDELGLYTLQSWKKQFDRCVKDNKLAEKCKETIDKLIKTEKVKERDLLALAWTIRFDLYKTLSAQKKEKI